MRLAVFLTPQQPCPPPGYGGHERQADIIVRKLMDRGHDVDLYAGPGSTCLATNLYTIPGNEERDEHPLMNKLMERHKEYDCVIDISSLHLPGQVDNVKSLSLFMGDDYRIRPHDEVKNRVYCSKELAYNWDSERHPILPNTICYDVSEIPLGDGSGGYALYVGTIHRKKGLGIAARAAAMAGLDFHVYGPINDKPLWDSIKSISKHMGILGKSGRWEVFGKALVFLHFPQVCDAGPIAPQEAMMCGTPVIASPHGGICSSLEDGVSGFFAYTPQDAAERIMRRLVRLDREKVRESIIQYADPNRHIQQLESLCSKVASGESW